MPPRRKSETTPAPSARRAAFTARERESDESMRARNVTPFLRPEHVSDGEWLKLTGFNAMKDRDTDREQYILEVENEHGHTFSLGIRTGSPDHRIFHRSFGEAFRQWRGSVQVTIADGRRGDVQFVNVKAVDHDWPVWDGSSAPAHSDDDRSE